MKVSSMAAAALRPKVSANTGAYQLLDISNKIPIARKPDKNVTSDHSSEMPMFMESAPTPEPELQTSVQSLSIDKTADPGIRRQVGNFGKRLSSPALALHQKSDLSSTSVPNRRHSIAQSYNLQSLVSPKPRRASVNSLKGVFGLFPDQTTHANDIVEENEEPLRPQGKSLGAFLRSGVGDSDSDSEERMDHVAMESRHLIKFRNVATGVMVWTIFLKQPRLPSKGKFRHAALLVLKFIKLQKHFMPVKTLYSHKSGLQKKATWNKMRDFFQGAKALKVIQPIKMKSQQPTTIEEEPENHEEINSSPQDVNTQTLLLKHRTSLIPEESVSHHIGPELPSGSIDISNRQLAEPRKHSQRRSIESMGRSQLKVSSSRLKLKADTTMVSPRSDAAPSTSYLESIVPSVSQQEDESESEDGSTRPLRVGLIQSQLPTERVDAAEVMKDWLSAQTEVLSSLAARSHFDDSFTTMTPGQILVDGNSWW